MKGKQFPPDRSHTMLEDTIFEHELFEDELKQVWIAAEAPSRDIAELLADLHTLKGAGFITMLKEITQHRTFCPLEGESNIYTTDGKKDDDYDNLLNAARKAVEHGYKVYILPNPKGIRTADFIFERKGVYKMFDLKTIHGKTIVGSRLIESIGQTNRVILNMTTEYNTRLMAADVRMYFETNSEALEVLIFKGKKMISIERFDALHPSFYRLFKKRYEK